MNSSYHSCGRGSLPAFAMNPNILTFVSFARFSTFPCIWQWPRSVKETWLCATVDKNRNWDFSCLNYIMPTLMFYSWGHY